DFLGRAESFARLVDELRRARRVALRGGEECGAHRQRQLERGRYELRGVLLVPVSARVRERAEQALRLRILRRGAPVLHLARSAREAPRPAARDRLERDLARVPVGQLLDKRRALVEADLAPGDRRPVTLLVLVEVLGIDALPLLLDDVDAAAHVRGDRHEPRRRREAAAGAALRAAA